VLIVFPQFYSKTKNLHGSHNIFVLHRAGDNNIYEKVFATTVVGMNMSAGLSE